MRFERFIKAMAPVAVMALATALSGCDGANVRIDGDEGKPLSELDLGGAAPKGLVLLGPDEVRIRQGNGLAITVDGDPAIVDALRFTLKDGTLGVLRKDGAWDGKGSAIVNVTMPAPESLVAAGSGSIRAESLGSKAEVTIAGSGDVETMNVAAEALEVTIAGSGSYRAGGTATRLDLPVAGGGEAAWGARKPDPADISITGSGRSAFASDGKVKASIMGSGVVRVQGRATCEVSATGSGKLVCEPAPQAEARPRRKTGRS